MTSLMTSLLNTHRHLYNSALAERKAAYETQKRTVGYQEQSAHLKTSRKENPYLAQANFSSCQRTLKRLDRAFQAFFRRIKSGEKEIERTPGYPRFRGYGRFDSVEFTHGDGAKLTTDGRAYFQNVGAVKVKRHRPQDAPPCRGQRQDCHFLSSGGPMVRRVRLRCPRR